MRLLQPVTIDYSAVLDVLGAEPMTTREVASAVGLGMETVRTQLHAAAADGHVELILGTVYTWCKRT